MLAEAARALSVDSCLRQLGALVDEEIMAVVDAEVDDPWMRGAIRYHFGWADTSFVPLPRDRWTPAGKKLRSALALLCHRSAAVDGGADQGPPVAFAAAVELVHNFSLVHDDIIDADRVRRGRPTLWSICGSRQAINAGDTMHALAFLCLGRLTVGPRVAAAMAALARAAVQITVGQRRDIAHETRQDIGVETYLEMVSNKTAALMACATATGAALALDPDRRVPAASTTVNRYREFGRHLGLAFQIRDDILGVWGVESVTGKPTGSDIRRRKMSLPVIIGFEAAPPEARSRLVSLYQASGELTVEQEGYVRSVLDECHAADVAQSLVDKHARQARLALSQIVEGTENLDVHACIGLLDRLTDRLTTRTN